MKAIFNDTIIAESYETILVEGNHYFPPDSVKKEYLSSEITDLHTACPWKGDASYYNISAGGQTKENAAWFYPDPKEGALHIKDYIAFYKIFVTVTE